MRSTENEQEGSNAPTVTRDERTPPSFVIAYATRVGTKLTIVVINRLRREGFDGKRIGDDFDGLSSRAVLARWGPTGLGFGLHGILCCSTDVRVTHKESCEGYNVLEYR